MSSPGRDIEISTPSIVEETTSNIELAESLALLQALTADIARRNGLRLLLIKGDSLTHHGLRRPRVHSDVDVLLSPDDADRFRALMAEIDWHPRLGKFVGYPVPHHSITLIHSNWNSDVDVHREFPGFFSPPKDVFEELWARRQAITSANQPVLITDFAGSTLIMALHDLRSDPDDPRFEAELSYLTEVSKSWSDEQRADVAALAAVTGCSQALSDLLPRLGVPVLGDDANSSDLRHWRAKIEGRATTFSTWWRSITSARPHRWPKLLWRAIWPSEDYLRTGKYLSSDDTRLNHARLVRLQSGLQHNARALLARLPGRSKRR